MENRLRLSENMYSPPGFSNIVSMMNPSMQFPECLRSLCISDGFFSKVVTDLNGYPSFKMIYDTLFMNDNSSIPLCIPGGNMNGV